MRKGHPIGCPSRRWSVGQPATARSAVLTLMYAEDDEFHINHKMTTSTAIVTMPVSQLPP